MRPDAAPDHARPHRLPKPLQRFPHDLLSLTYPVQSNSLEKMQLDVP